MRTKVKIPQHNRLEAIQYNILLFQSYYSHRQTAAEVTYKQFCFSKTLKLSNYTETLRDR